MMNLSLCIILHAFLAKIANIRVYDVNFFNFFRNKKLEKIYHNTWIFYSYLKKIYNYFLQFKVDDENKDKELSTSEKG